MKNIRKILSLLKNPQILRRFAVVIMLLIVIVGFFYYQKTTGRIFIDNSVISAPVIPVAPVAPGTLNKLFVYEGQAIKTGEPIADVGDQTIRVQSDALVVKAQNMIGSIISAQNPVISLIRISDLRVDGTIDENKGLNQIKIGQPVSFTLDAFPGKIYWGFVDEISPTAKQTQITFSISNERPTQQFDVFVKFDASSYPEVKNGMSAKMTVFTK